MAQLAIKGHKSRGNEVIEILEMLGGNNANNCYGKYCDRVYYINENGYIDQDFTTHIEQDTKFIIFSLEEFLEKYPYKVGDKVLYKHDNKIFFIRKMFWKNDKILYELSDEVYSDGCSIPDTIIFDVDVVKLQPYKEETMEERKYSELRMPLDDDDKLATEMTIDGNKILPPNGYLIGKITQVDNGLLVEYVKKQPQYPKTYKECCEVLLLNSESATWSIGGLEYKRHLIVKLQRLIICRDAYWKIAGNWKPDVMYCDLYCIGYDGNVITWKMQGGCRLLAFPTEEMRDAFYENFKELIELVKELL